MEPLQEEESFALSDGPDDAAIQEIRGPVCASNMVRMYSKPHHSSSLDFT
jgi:hypothetical protein